MNRRVRRFAKEDPTDLHIRMGPREDLHQTLLTLATEVSADSAVRLVHACATCGGTDHGQPRVLTSSGSLNASLSRPSEGERGVVALCAGARVGIDIEAAGAASFTSFDGVALHPHERCTDDAERTRLWVRKEAVLKAHGTGLMTDPRALRLSVDGAVLAGPSATVIDLDLGPGWTGAVAVTPPTELRVLLSP